MIVWSRLGERKRIGLGKWKIWCLSYSDGACIRQLIELSPKTDWFGPGTCLPNGGRRSKNEELWLVFLVDFESKFESDPRPVGGGGGCFS